MVAFYHIIARFMPFVIKKFKKCRLTYTTRGYIINIPQWGILSGGMDTMNQEEQVCPCHKTRERTEEEYTCLIHRLNRIEGQVRGIRGMVEKNAYCTDILVQVAAVNAALAAFNRELLGQHIKTCVKRDILAGKDETLDELLNTLQKLMK